MSRSTWDTLRRLQDFAYEPFTLYGRSFHIFLLSIHLPHQSPATSATETMANLGFSFFARRYLRNLFRFLFLWVLRCFSSPGIALRRKPPQFYHMTDRRFPHSEISGSKSVCDSPERIAAYHVLHRLVLPSHPL